MAAAIPSARTPLDHRHFKHAAQLQDCGGWRLPVVYTSAEHEAAVVRDAVGLTDLSALAKLSVRGGQVAALANAFDFGDKLQDPRGVAWLDAGTPCLGCRLTDDSLLFLGTSTTLDGLTHLPNVGEKAPGLVQQDVSSFLAGFCLFGPFTHVVLQRLTALDVSAQALPPGSCAETKLADVHALLIRPPRLAVDAIGLYVAWDLGEYIWDIVAKAGQKVGLEPIGLTTWRALLPQGHVRNSAVPQFGHSPDV